MTTVAMQSADRKVERNRIQGLDSIRFVCAAVVMLSHFGTPLPRLADEDSMVVYRLARGLLANLFNGPAAVIVFFVVSGFCIHYPFRDGRHGSVTSYYIRRLCRISIPAFAAIGIWYVYDIPFPPPELGVLWSVICEVIYYILYPGLRRLRDLVGWPVIVICSYVGVYALFIAHPQLLIDARGGYSSLGLWTWVVGLPCWLLGCWLAENYSRFTVLSTGKMWALRIVVAAITVVLRVVKFHVHSPWAANSITLNAFAIVACIWLGYEIAYFTRHKPIRALEWAGIWSYSLYLMHVVAPAIVVSIGADRYVPRVISATIVAMGISYLFYRAVEMPSHKLAVYLSRTDWAKGTGAASTKNVKEQTIGGHSSAEAVGGSKREHAAL